MSLLFRIAKSLPDIDELTEFKTRRLIVRIRELKQAASASKKEALATRQKLNGEIALLQKRLRSVDRRSNRTFKTNILTEKALAGELNFVISDGAAGTVKASDLNAAEAGKFALFFTASLESNKGERQTWGNFPLPDPTQVTTAADGDIGATVLETGLVLEDGSILYKAVPDTDAGATRVWQAGVKSTGVLTLTANAANTETVVIDGKTYTYQTVLTDTDGNVLIGASASDSLDNLIAAILTSAGGGTNYAAATTLHPAVLAAAGAGDTMDVTAKLAGTAGDVATTETLGNGSWGGATLTGGADPDTIEETAPIGDASPVVAAMSPAVPDAVKTWTVV